MKINPLDEDNMEPFAKEDYEPSKPQSATRLGNSDTPAPNVMLKGSGKVAQETPDIYQRATRTFSGAYDKTTEKVSRTYCKARDYSHDNPGKAMLITLGVGMGIGLLLGANSHHNSRTSRMAQPVINALSDVATQLFR